MTRKRVTASEKKQRHEWAIRQIDAGMGLSELTAFTAETWGCSRRHARDVVAKAHKDWLDACYGSEEIDQRDLLFPSNKRNGLLTRQAVAARMAMWGREANVRLHPHRFRHTHATHAIRRGVDVFTISATLGHSSTGTTSHYVLAEPGESSSLKLG